MTELVTPAKDHNNQYPKPQLGLHKSNPMDVIDNIAYKKVLWFNDVETGGHWTMPTGDFVKVNYAQNAAIDGIVLDVNKNFNPNTGFFMFELKTNSTYEPKQCAFVLDHIGGQFYYTLKPSMNYKFVFALAKQDSSVIEIVPVLITEVAV